MILKGKRVLIAGMSDRRSIGFSIAQEAQRAGAEILLTSFGRMMSITEMTAKKLNPVPEILEMDVTKASDIEEAAKETAKRWDRLDGLVHSVAFAAAEDLEGRFTDTPRDRFWMALDVSAYSLVACARLAEPLMEAAGGGSILTMTYRQQVILDTGEGTPGIAGTGTFTVMNLLTVSALQTFEIAGESYRLGKHRDQFRQFYSGAPPATTPPSGVFAGYAVAIERAQPDKD